MNTFVSAVSHPYPQKSEGSYRMFVILSAFIISAVVLLLVSTLTSCRNAPSYESAFRDEIFIDFPPGHLSGDGLRMYTAIDLHLRCNQIGLAGGILGGEREVDFITIETDFSKIDEEALVQLFITSGLLPPDVTARYETAK